jgi:DNA-binding response OmpR family regulator
VLEREGHRVDSADDVDGALYALSLDRFDLVICDYRMPGKTGIDLLVEMKNARSTVPVLMITAYADAATEARARELGAVDLLRKPIRRQELVRRAEHVGGGLYGQSGHL